MSRKSDVGMANVKYHLLIILTTCTLVGAVSFYFVDGIITAKDVRTVEFPFGNIGTTLLLDGRANRSLPRTTWFSDVNGEFVLPLRLMLPSLPFIPVDDCLDGLDQTECIAMLPGGRWNILDAADTTTLCLEAPRDVTKLAFCQNKETTVITCIDARTLVLCQNYTLLAANGLVTDHYCRLTVGEEFRWNATLTREFNVTVSVAVRGIRLSYDNSGANITISTTLTDEVLTVSTSSISTDFLQWNPDDSNTVLFQATAVADTQTRYVLLHIILSADL